MNPTQIQTTIAPLITFLAGLAAGRGLFGLDAAAWTAIIGGIVGLGATVWAAVVTRKTTLVTTVAQMPEVQSVRLEPSVRQNDALITTTPSNVTSGGA
jgi:hypothetical protein